MICLTEEFKFLKLNHSSGKAHEVRFCSWNRFCRKTKTASSIRKYKWKKDVIEKCCCLWKYRHISSLFTTVLIRESGPCNIKKNLLYEPFIIPNVCNVFVWFAVLFIKTYVAKVSLSIKVKYFLTQKWGSLADSFFSNRQAHNRFMSFHTHNFAVFAPEEDGACAKYFLMQLSCAVQLILFKSTAYKIPTKCGLFIGFLSLFWSRMNHTRYVTLLGFCSLDWLFLKKITLQRSFFLLLSKFLICY